MSSRNQFSKAFIVALFIAALGAGAGAAHAAGSIVVATAADSGAGSLRQAILDANGAVGADVIEFNLAEGDCSAAGVCEIVIASDLPAITDDLTIDGTTQPRRGTAPANVCATPTTPSFMRVQVRVSGGYRMFNVQGSVSAVIRGLSMISSGDSFDTLGVILDSTSGESWIYCNHFGLNGEGTAAFPLESGLCFGCYGLADGGLIGTNGDGVDDVAERNVFAGFGRGINQNGNGNLRVSGNYFGLGADGVTPLGMTSCVFARQTANNSLFGSNFDAVADDVERNVMGNCINGFQYDAEVTGVGNVIAGNWIGFDATGAIANVGTGIRLEATTPPVKLDRNHIEGATARALILKGSATLAGGSTNNCIRGNAVGLQHEGSENVDFTLNFWGDPSGPSGDEAGSGDSVFATSTGVLTVSPWLTTAPDSCRTPRIFSDDFESGDTSHWSATVPPPA